MQQVERMHPPKNLTKTAPRLVFADDLVCGWLSHLEQHVEWQLHESSSVSGQQASTLTTVAHGCREGRRRMFWERGGAISRPFGRWTQGGGGHGDGMNPRWNEASIFKSRPCDQSDAFPTANPISFLK